MLLPPLLALLALLALLPAVARRRSRARAGRRSGSAATAAARRCLHHFLLALHINKNTTELATSLTSQLHRDLISRQAGVETIVSRSYRDEILLRVHRCCGRCCLLDPSVWPVGCSLSVDLSTSLLRRSYMPFGKPSPPMSDDS